MKTQILLKKNTHHHKTPTTINPDKKNALQNVYKHLHNRR